MIFSKQKCFPLSMKHGSGKTNWRMLVFNRIEVASGDSWNKQFVWEIVYKIVVGGIETIFNGERR